MTHQDKAIMESFELIPDLNTWCTNLKMKKGFLFQCCLDEATLMSITVIN